MFFGEEEEGKRSFAVKARQSETRASFSKEGPRRVGIVETHRRLDTRRLTDGRERITQNPERN